MGNTKGLFGSHVYKTKKPRETKEWGRKVDAEHMMRKREMIIGERFLVRRSHGTPLQSLDPNHADGNFFKKNHWLFLRYMTIFNYDHGKFCKVAMATLVEIAWN